MLPAFLAAFIRMYVVDSGRKIEAAELPGSLQVCDAGASSFYKPLNDPGKTLEFRIFPQDKLNS